MKTNKNTSQKSLPLQENGMIKPCVNKAYFYIRENWGFPYLVFEKLEQEFHEDDYVDYLPPILQMLLYFPRVAGQVSNGGFDQLYYNGYAYAVKGCLAGLEELGENEIADLLRVSYVANLIYENDNTINEQDLIDLNQDEITQKLHQSYGNFSKNIESLYEIIGMDMDEMNKKMWDKDDDVMDKLVNHIKANVNLYLFDEYGNTFDENYTGVYEYGDTTDGYIIHLKSGKLHGRSQIFYPLSDSDYSSTIDDIYEFDNGFLTYHEHKMIWNQKENKPYTQFKTYYQQSGDDIIKTEETYYKNSTQIETQESRLKNNWRVRVGEWKSWYENGQLKEITIYQNNEVISSKNYHDNGRVQHEWQNNGLWSKYYANGQKESEVVFIDENKQEHANWWYDTGERAGYTVLDDDGHFMEYCCLYKNGQKSLEFTFLEVGNRFIKPKNAWDENGKQIVKDGTGVLDFRQFFGHKWVGSKYEFGGGYLIEHYQDGLRHGLSEEFYQDGKIYCRDEFVHGKRISYCYFDEDGNIKK